MKAYHKWNDEQCARNCDQPKSDVCGGCPGLVTREDVWRAAIKHISKRIGKYALCANTLPYLRKHIERIIKQELGDGL